MQIRDLLNQIGTFDNEIIEGDYFDIELDDIIIESSVIGTRGDGIIISVDDTALAYLNTQEILESTQQNEAEYQGRKVSIGKPFLTPDGPKKRSVYVKRPDGKVVKVNFGDKKLSIKKHLPNRRKSFKARHRCATPGPKTKARYWSCRAW